ncbi:hypothetical protein ETC03_07130 [Geobacillus sp. MMMUD3]|uniref:hypothetical protein n=1 Tax=Geobacillus thermoleovorans TaxID=33941 RepID=UPI0009C156D1|nr:hypothetical protein [Geobacillus thermoleovorans]NNV06219.1 hypothetical protein [Geobacillus sp. MMMUD3]OQP12845.1 hypothetical protein B1692_10175 [Geobacillus thermoleovorans]QNU22956.1 hypothetical protein IC805_08705 [Geobacillus thermoleovorans]
MYRAIWRVKHNHTIYEPGETITGLSADAAKELLQLKAIEIIPTAPGVESKEQEADGMAAFKATLHAMKRTELFSYAKKVGVDVDQKMKNAEICDILFDDAQKNGVDIEAFDDHSLVFFAEKLGYHFEELPERQQVIEMIDARLEGGHE